MFVFCLKDDFFGDVNLNTYLELLRPTSFGRGGRVLKCCAIYRFLAQLVEESSCN